MPLKSCSGSLAYNSETYQSQKQENKENLLSFLIFKFKSSPESKIIYHANENRELFEGDGRSFTLISRGSLYFLGLLPMAVESSNFSFF